MHVDNKGIIDGLWRGERKCIEPKAADADLWIRIWEELQLSTSKEILVEVEHVKAHRTEKEKKEMAQFEKFVAGGNERVDEFSKGRSDVGRRIHGADKSKKRFSRKREEVYAALQYASSFHRYCQELKPQPKETWFFF